MRAKTATRSKRSVSPHWRRFGSRSVRGILSALQEGVLSIDMAGLLFTAAVKNYELAQRAHTVLVRATERVERSRSEKANRRADLIGKFSLADMVALRDIEQRLAPYL